MKNLFPICKKRDVSRCMTHTEHQIAEPKNKLSVAYNNQTVKCIDKARNIKSFKVRKLSPKGRSIRITPNIIMEMLNARRDPGLIFYKL